MSSNNPATPGGQRPEQVSWSETDNRDGVIVEFDGPGDTTVRPARSAILRQIRPDQPPPAPPEKK